MAKEIRQGINRDTKGNCQSTWTRVKPKKTAKEQEGFGRGPEGYTKRLTARNAGNSILAQLGP